VIHTPASPLQIEDEILFPARFRYRAGECFDGIVQPMKRVQEAGRPYGPSELQKRTNVAEPPARSLRLMQRFHEAIRACGPSRLPVVKSREEVKVVLENLTGDRGLMRRICSRAVTIYGPSRNSWATKMSERR
jgi:hypothetical protein